MALKNSTVSLTNIKRQLFIPLTAECAYFWHCFVLFVQIEALVEHSSLLHLWKTTQFMKTTQKVHWVLNSCGKHLPKPLAKESQPLNLILKSNCEYKAGCQGLGLWLTVDVLLESFCFWSTVRVAFLTWSASSHVHR